MLAQENPTIDQTISSVWQLTQDEAIREQMQRREENERIWNSMRRKVAEAEKKAAEAEMKVAEAEMKAAEEKKEYTKEIEELKARIQELEGNK